MYESDCRYCHDEFCVNDKSPCCADYCPVVNYPEICSFFEKAEADSEE